MAEVDTDQRRMTQWRASFRKDKKRTTALQMDAEWREEIHGLGKPHGNKAPEAVRGL